VAEVVFELILLGFRLFAWYVRLLVRCWRIVSRWMTPRWPADPHVKRLQAWRSWLGYASVVIAVTLSGDASDGLADDMVTGALLGFALKAAVAVPAFVVGMLIVTFRSHRTQRRLRLLPTARPFALTVAVVVIPLLGLAVENWAESRPGGPPPTGGSAVQIVAIVVPLAAPFVLVAGAAVLVTGVRHLFCAGDVHPLLPSVLAFVVALASGVENVSQAVQPEVGVEHTLSLLGVGGALTVLGLTAYEHHRLRTSGWHWGDLQVALDELPAGHPLRASARGD